MNIHTTQIESQIFDLLEKQLNVMGYEIVRLRYGGSKESKRLQMMIDRTDNQNVNINDCEEVTKYASLILEVENLLEDEFSFEVSSTGLNRPLTRSKDFISRVGSNIKLSTKLPIEGQKNFKGSIISASDEEVVLDLMDNKGQMPFRYSSVSEATLLYFEEKENKNKRGKDGKLQTQ